MNQPNQSLLNFLWFPAWLSVAGFALLVQFCLLWMLTQDPFTYSALINGYAAVRKLGSFDIYAIYTILLSGLASSLFWFAGIAITLLVRRSKSTARRRILLIAFSMLVMPVPFILNGLGMNTNLPEPWEMLLKITGVLLGWVGVLLYLLLAYLAPDGRFVPGWLGWVCLGLLGGLTALFVLPMLDLLRSDWLWAATLLGLLTTLLVGLASQIYRFNKSSPDERRQRRGIFIALLAQPIAWLGGLFISGSTLGSLLGWHLQIILLALLPISILEAMQRRGLWQDQPGGPALNLDKRWVGGLALALMFALTLAYQNAQRSSAQVFEPFKVETAPKPVIIDTDMAPDDWMAILFLLQRPDIDILAITVSGTGEVHCTPGVRNALGLVALAGEGSIPAACGRETPLEGNHVFPEAWRERADTMDGMSLPDVQIPNGGTDAAEQISQILRDSPQKVTILALGPLTNLAEAIQRQPALIKNTEAIVIMGGALEVIGNVGYSGIDNQVAEWNFYIDPLAAQIVLDSGAPIMLAPLDATNDVPVSLEFYRLLKANRRTPEAKFVHELLTNQLDFIASGGYYFWDPLAAGLLADPSLGYIKEGRVKVFTAEGPSSGLTRLMPTGAPVRYTVTAQAELFYQELLRTLNQP